MVHENETAVFFRDGKAYDTFGPGRHTLTTLNLPLLTRILTRLVGFAETPFKANVIFVSMRQFPGKWGARAQTTDLAPLLINGSVYVRVGTPQVFVNEVVGMRGNYTTPAVNAFLRGFINERIIDSLSRYDLTAVFTKLDETSIEVKNNILDAFKRIGLDLIDLKFEAVDTTPEYRERLFWLKATGSPQEVLRMQTVKEAAGELGKSPGAALGAGMVLIPPLFGQTQGTTAAPQVTLIVCPNCKAHVPADSKFCPNCGTPLTSPKTPQSPQPPLTKTCPKCGQNVSAAASFCPECGQKLQ
ncbi:SPFH domain-containing protein [Candidatus Bathyarchaeota archaeon]|nr:SPFH domain-containing protein [Candidatus Bathyarchaeota archaeon]